MIFYKPTAGLGISKKQIRPIHNPLCDPVEYDGELQMFKLIALEREMCSQISKQALISPSPSNFLHVLPKAQGKYPEFRLYAPNIVLGTVREHELWDNLRGDIDFSDPGWAMMLQLEAVLLELYHQLYM
jgi:hypothetical protein